MKIPLLLFFKAEDKERRKKWNISFFLSEKGLNTKEIKYLSFPSLFPFSFLPLLKEKIPKEREKSLERRRGEDGKKERIEEEERKKTERRIKRKG